MKDHRDFADFYEASLQFFYEAGMAIRLSAGKQTFRLLCMVVIVIATACLWGRAPKVLLIPAAAAGLYWLATSHSFKNEKYRVSLAKVHQEALNELVWIHDRAWRYTLRAPKVRREIRESGLFNHNVDFIHEKGCISGPVGMCLMAAVKVDMGNILEVTQRIGRLSMTKRHHRPTFSGFFIAMDFPRSFTGTVILRRGAQSNLSMNHEAFDNIFQVQTRDHDLAREVLTPFMLDQLVNLDSRLSQFPFTVTFKDSCVYVSLPWEKELFAPAFDDNARFQAAYDDSLAIEVISVISKELLAEQFMDRKRKTS
ncbi:hypothetical protein AZI86_13075 [Bdellovibrio bacteriovorus]|uniref:DUF3137 domain-containing protein n=1 Tax=Bdellovibrio bacteriovorus TaxID=959 RepID=A0A150WJQ0_BDEBC|nr:DUF3137 domain-containing protein [Bdellovibrio bacteriovorus]KYG63751.1 hypothetical protein AZI86_13075 [Bdellovibrio bacteriovorus]